MNAEALRALPSIPCDMEGPVFREPWEAQAFAIAVRLHEQGCFSWSEWAATLSEEISRAQREGDPDLGTTYYHHWLRALERLVEAKSLVAIKDVDSRAALLRAGTPAQPHDHDDGDSQDRTAGE